MGAARSHPRVDVAPRELPNLAFDQAREAALDAEHGEAVVHAQAHGGLGCRVHSRSEPAGVHDRHARRPAEPGRRGRFVGGGNGGGHGLEDADHPLVRAAAGRDGALIVARGEHPLDGARVADRLHEREADDPVSAGADDARFVLLARVDHFEGRRVAEDGRHPPVVGRGGAAALDVAQRRDAHVLAQALGEEVADLRGRDGGPRAVLGSFGHDDERIPAARRPALPELLAQAVLPPVGRGELGDEGVVASARDRAHQREVPAAAPHDLDDERALVRGGRRRDGVDRLDDAVEGRVGSHRHVRADQVVVDRADHARQVQPGVGLRGLGRDLPPLDEFGQEFAPQFAELVGAREGSVASDGHDAVDAPGDEVADGGPQPVALAEGRAAGRADGRPTLVEDARDVRPRQLGDETPAFDGALPPLVHGVGDGALVDGGAHDGAHHGVHSLGVSARRQYGDLGRLGHGELLRLGAYHYCAPSPFASGGFRRNRRRSRAPGRGP